MTDESPNTGPLTGRGVYTWALTLLIILAGWLAFRVFSPFLTPIILATVLAAMFYPLFLRLERGFGGRPSPAAGVVLLIVIFCICLPLFLFFTGLVTQAATSIAELNAWLRAADVDALLAKLRLEPVLAWAQAKFPFLDLQALDFQTGMLQFSRKVGQTMISLGTSMVGNAFHMLIHFLIMLFILFFLLRDGRRILASIKYLSPLHEDQEDRIIQSLRNVSRSVLVGGLLVALLQGLAGGVGLSFVGIPSLFWGTMMGFASLVPVVGTGLIWGPAVIYLFVVAQWKSALFLLVWCGLGVTSIDTFLRPYFMREAAGISMLYIFLSVIGGLQIFGPAGLLYGPLILAFALVMMRIYGEEFREILEARPCPAHMECVAPQAEAEAEPAPEPALEPGKAEGTD